MKQAVTASCPRARKKKSATGTRALTRRVRPLPFCAGDDFPPRRRPPLLFLSRRTPAPALRPLCAGGVYHQEMGRVFLFVCFVIIPFLAPSANGHGPEFTGNAADVTRRQSRPSRTVTPEGERGNDETTSGCHETARRLPGHPVTPKHQLLSHGQQVNPTPPIPTTYCLSCSPQGQNGCFCTS